MRNWLVVVLALAAVPAAAQDGSITGEGGFQPNREYLALQPFETLDTGSDNLILRFTDLVLPGISR